MIYLKELKLASDHDETKEILREKRTCFGTMYPFKIFPDKNLERLTFEPVTFFCGGNGSGKSTLLNIISEKIHAIRHSEYNKSAFFETYTDLCRINAAELPQNSQMLSSDDVFDYVMNMRYLNNNVDFHREELFRDTVCIRLSRSTKRATSAFTVWTIMTAGKRYIRLYQKHNPNLSKNAFPETSICTPTEKQPCGISQNISIRMRFICWTNPKTVFP